VRVVAAQPTAGEFSENSPHLQGGFEEEKSKKKNLHNLRVPLGFY
jgi:hypothetical protein